LFLFINYVYINDVLPVQAPTAYAVVGVVDDQLILDICQVGEP
jgi:hypothetical protein